jgi:hypothetical protein
MPITAQGDMKMMKYAFQAASSLVRHARQRGNAWAQGLH